MEVRYRFIGFMIIRHTLGSDLRLCVRSKGRAEAGKLLSVDDGLTRGVLTVLDVLFSSEIGGKPCMLP